MGVVYFPRVFTLVLFSALASGLAGFAFSAAANGMSITEINPMHTTMIATCVFVAAVLSGATGLGFPLLAVPIFLLDYAPPQAVLMACICSLIGQSFAVAILRQTVCFEVRWPLVLSGMLGVPLGTVLLLLTDGGALRFGLAILLIFSSVWLLIGGCVYVRRAAGISELLVGLSGGICGGLFGVSSAVPATWLSACGLDKIRQRAIIQPYIIAAQCISLILLCLHDTLTVVVIRALAIYIVPLVCGVAIGAAGFRVVSSGMYSRAVLAMTLLSGLMLLFR
jgi:uncharacterized protein